MCITWHSYEDASKAYRKCDNILHLDSWKCKNKLKRKHMHLHIYCKTCLHSIRSIEIEEKKVNQIENFMSIQSDCKSESGVPSFNRVHNRTS